MRLSEKRIESDFNRILSRVSDRSRRSGITKRLLRPYSLLRQAQQYAKAECVSEILCNSIKIGLKLIRDQIR